MTKKEALMGVLQVSVPDVSVEKALIDKGLTGSDSYSLSSEKEIDLCAVSIYQSLLAVPDLNEGDIALKYDRQGIKSALLFLCQKHALTDVILQFKPTVTSKRVW